MPAKYLRHNGTGGMAEVEAIDSSTGAPDAGKIPALDSTGRLPTNMMPSGIGADTQVIQASEALAAGDLVNIHNVTGNARVRKADAATAGKEAHGFVLAAVASGANATVYFEGTNAQVTGQTPGPVYLSATTPGLATGTPPAASGNVVQRVGLAVSATAVNFEQGAAVTLA
jgi:hypothetical protein